METRRNEAKKAAERSGSEGTALSRDIRRANEYIAELGRRDSVDTSLYGFMVRKAGRMSMALHPGIHPSEVAPAAADGRDDPRVPRAEVGFTLGGSLRPEFRARIDARHADLVRLHLWTEGLGGRRPDAADLRWDPVLLSLLRLHGADLECIASFGPGGFANPAGRRDRPDATRVVDAPRDDDTPYVAILDGDAVRVEMIRYAPGASYSWRRRQPGVVELSAAGLKLSEKAVGGLRGCRFSALVGHPSLDAVLIQSVTATPDGVVVRAASRLERIRRED